MSLPDSAVGPLPETCRNIVILATADGPLDMVDYAQRFGRAALDHELAMIGLVLNHPPIYTPTAEENAACDGFWGIDPRPTREAK